MKKLICFATVLFLLQTVIANSAIPNAAIVQPRIVSNNTELIPQQKTHQKLHLKDRILLKWYKKKSQQPITEETKKKNVKLLGFLSLATGAAAILLLLFASLIYSEVVIGIFLFLMLCFVPTALILGILSLSKRKKLVDKKGTSALPAILGIILASAFLVTLIIALIDISINGFF